MRRIFLPPFIIAIALISACASAPEKGARPDWIDGQSQRYSQQLYLTGQGSGDTLDDAKDRARADLAKQFEVAVQERSQQQQEYRKQQQGEESSESLNQQVTRQLITRTTRTVQGIEIASTWEDPASHTYYALAVLSRNKARQQYEQQITSLDQQVGQRLKQAEKETDTLRKTGLLQQAIDTQQQRISAQSALQVVDPSGRGIPSPVSLGELLRTRDSLIERITLLPKTEGKLDFLVQPILSGNAANAGFKITAEKTADYTLIADTQLEPPLKEGGWIWLRGTLELTLRDSKGHDIGVRRWSLKAASITTENTEHRLLNQIDGILKRDLRPTLLGFAMYQ
jgi:hypothetical protein